MHAFVYQIFIGCQLPAKLIVPRKLDGARCGTRSERMTVRNHAYSLPLSTGLIRMCEPEKPRRFIKNAD